MRKFIFFTILLILNDIILLWIAHHGQIQYNLVGDETKQCAPFRVNASTDVPAIFVTDMSCGKSLLAVSMDKDAMGKNRSGDTQYSAYFGWMSTEQGNLYFDRRFLDKNTVWHDNEKVYIHVGGQGDGRPNHVMIGDDYIMPYGIGKPGQVITVPTAGKQLLWK